MDGYLFDVNALSDWFNEKPHIKTRVDSLGENPLRVSAITLGELAFGYELHLAGRDLQRRDEFDKWVDRQFPAPTILAVKKHTRHYYGRLRARLFETYIPTRQDENHPECCYDPVTGKELGIDENDLWIALQAIEHSLVLVTSDNMQ